MAIEKVLTIDSIKKIAAQVNDDDTILVGTGIKSSSGSLTLSPFSDSTTAIRITNSEGTVVLTVDTSNLVLDLNSHRISNVLDPQNAQDAATRNYVDGKSFPSGSTGQILQYKLAWAGTALDDLEASSNVTISPALGDNQRQLILRAQSSSTAATAGGATTLIGGSSTTGTGGSTYVLGGAASSTGTGGSVFIRGGNTSGGTYGSISIGDSNTVEVNLGGGSHYVKYTNSTYTLEPIGSGLIIATGLKSATTTVGVSASAAPSNGYVLQATSGSAASWQNLSAATPAAIASTGSAGSSTGIARDDHVHPAMPFPGGEPVGFENRTDSEISFNDGNRRFTIQPKSPATSFTVWNGLNSKVTKSAAETLDITNTVGQHFIYYNGSTLAESSTFPGFNSVFIALVYWDGSKSLGLADERHMVVMDAATHSYLHNTVGTRYQSGFGLTRLTTGTGSADTDAQVSADGGTIWDEDIRIVITRAASPANPFEQELGLSTTTPGKFPIFYRSGSSGPWTKDTATNFPVRPFDGSAGSRVGYNLDTAGTWSVTDPGADNYVAVWVIATDSVYEPVIAVMGQRFDTSLVDAQNNNTYSALSFGDLPFQEMKLLYRLIFKTSTAYSNTIKAYVADVQDNRSVSNLPAGTYVATDHSSLSGRTADNSHPATAIGTTTTNFNGILTGSDSNVQLALDSIVSKVKMGTGSPEGVVSAVVGSIYLRTDGSRGVTVYRKSYSTDGVQLLSDGSMEAADTSAYGSYNSSTLSKETINPHSGTRCLRVTRSGGLGGASVANACTIGQSYRIRGWCRGDGVSSASVLNVSFNDIFAGTNGTTQWQYFDAVFTAAGTSIILGKNSGGTWVEFDDVTLELVVSPSAYGWVAEQVLLENGALSNILQWDGTNWAPTSLSRLNANSYVVISPADGDNQRSLTIRAQSASTSGVGGGYTALIGGTGNDTGAGGWTLLAGGPSSGSGVGGATYIRGGDSTSGTDGSVYIADLNSTYAYFGAGTNGTRFTLSTNTLEPIGTGVIVSNALKSATTNVTTTATTPAVASILQATSTTAASWVALSALDASANVMVSPASGDNQRYITLRGQNAVTNGVAGGYAAVTGGAGLTTGAGGNAYVNGGASVSGAAGNTHISGGSSSGSGTGGHSYLVGGGSVSGAGGHAIIRGGNTSGTLGSVYIADAYTSYIYLGAGTNGARFNPTTSTLEPIGTGIIVSNALKSATTNVTTTTTTPAVASILQATSTTAASWVALSALDASSNVTISPVAGNNQRWLTLQAQNAVAAATTGGTLVLRGGNATTTATGGSAYLVGGDASSGGTGGNVYIRGGAASTTGNIFLADLYTTYVYLGAGTDGARFTLSTNTLEPIGTGKITANQLTASSVTCLGSTTITLAAGDNQRWVIIAGQSTTTAGVNAGPAYVTGGDSTTGVGGSAVIKGGTASGAGTGGTAYIRGGGTTGGTLGSVVLGDSNTAAVTIGGGANYLQYNTTTLILTTVGTAKIQATGLKYSGGTIDTTAASTPSNGQALVATSATTATWQTLSYQPSDATLTALAGLTTSANNLILCTGADTFSVGQLTDAYVAAANKDGVAGTASLRTLGTGAQQAAAGNHTHSYQPLDATLTALAGLTTSANTLILNTGADTFSVGALTDAYVAAANKDGVAGTASLRTLGTGAQQACAGNDSRLSDDRTASGLRSATTVVAVSTATAPTTGQVLTATSGTAATWQTPASGLPAGTAGYVLQYNGSAWANTSLAALYGQNTTIGFADGNSSYYIYVKGQNAASGNTAGGQARLLGGNGFGSGAGGTCVVQAGDGGTTGNGGGLTVRAGYGSTLGGTTGNGGTLSLYGGNCFGTTSGTGGQVNVYGGDGSLTQGSGGQVNIYGGYGYGSGSGGGVYISGGVNNTFATGTGSGGHISLVAGRAGYAGGSPGDVYLTAGGSDTGAGGVIQISAGYGSGGGSNNGTVYVGYSDTYRVVFGAGTNGVYYDVSGNTLTTYATGNIVANQIKTTGTPVTLSTTAPTGAGQALVSTSTTAAAWTTLAGLPSGTTAHVLQYNGSAWASTSLASLDASADVTISPAAGNNQRAILVQAQNAVSGAPGGEAYFLGGFSNASSTGGGNAYLRGGGTIGSGTGGSVYINGGLSVSSTGGHVRISGGGGAGGDGSIYLGYTEADTYRVVFGAGTNGVYYDVSGNTLTTYATGNIVANQIKTTGTAVTISTTAPTTGQILVATSASAAQWQDPAGGVGVPTTSGTLPVYEAVKKGQALGIIYDTSSARPEYQLVRGNADFGTNTTPYVSGLAYTDASAGGDVRVATSGDLTFTHDGSGTIVWDGTAPTNSDSGKPVWLKVDATNFGRLTMTMPTTGYRTRVGYFKSVSSTSYTVAIQIGESVLLT